MYDDVLLPTDGTSGTVEALAHARTIAADQGARVHVLYVVDRRLYTAADAEHKDEIRQSLEEEAEVALDDARVRLEDEGIECVTASADGVPHREITDYADAEGVALVVMGTHGTRESERVAALGSTTERVVQRADVPVLVVDID
jgi:nucleotide-binding universal stress UspA family protein